MKPHPIADIFPMLDAVDFDTLVQSIEASGQIAPVVTWEGWLLDGRNRWAACQHLGIECQTREFNGSEKEAMDLALGLNLCRRHLTPSQRAAIAVEVLPMYEKAARGRMTGGSTMLCEGRKAAADAARAAGASQSYVEQAKRLAAEDPDTFEAVKRGEVTLSEARGRAKTPPEVKAAKAIDMVDDIEHLRTLLARIEARIAELAS